MQRSAYSVTGHTADDAEAEAFHIRTDCVRNVAQTLADANLLDTLEEAVLANLNQFTFFKIDLSHREGACGVAVEAFYSCSHVDADYFAFAKNSFGGNAVHYLLIDGNTGGCRKSVQVFEVGHRPSASYEVFHQLVELCGGYAGLYVGLDKTERIAHDFTRFTHTSLFVTVLYRDHQPLIASRIAPNTLSIGSIPSTFTSTP